MTPLEILEAHESSLNHLTGGTKCRCGWRSGNEPARWVQHLAHVAQVLDQHVREREALALEEAASVVHSEARWQWELHQRHTVGAQIVAQRMTVIEEILRDRAEQYKEES